MGKKSMANVHKLIMVAAIALSGTASSHAMAAPVQEKDVMKNVASYVQWNSPVGLSLDGKLLPEKAEMINTQILVPLRAFFEAAGAEIRWDEKTDSIHVSGKGYTVVQKLGESKAVINGISVQLDHEAVIVNGRLMASVRMLPLALGVEVKWDSANRVLSLNSKQAVDAGFVVSSAAFPSNGDIPVKYAHGGIAGGQNINLPVSWKNAPEGTKSFAVVMYDLHPIADNWIHWSVINLPSSLKGLDEAVDGKVKAGTEVNAYYGMEPPQFSGDHQYRIVVYALDTEKLELKNQPSFFEELEPALKEHALASSHVDGFFRP